MKKRWAFLFFLILACSLLYGEEKKFDYVAIMDFKVLSSEEAYGILAEEIPQTLTLAFRESKYVRAVERQEMEKILGELKLSMSGLTDEETALEVGRILNAKYILLGSLTVLLDNVRINCRLIATETSEIVFTDSVRGNAADIFDLEDVLSARLEEHFSKK